MTVEEPGDECSIVRMPDGSVMRVRHQRGEPPSAAAVEALGKLKSYLEAHPEGPEPGEDLDVDATEEDE